MAENYTLESGVNLSLDIKGKVKKIADAYHLATNKKIVVTSGTRTAQSQAEAMYSKLAGGDNLAVYSNQSAARKIKEIFEKGIAAKKKKDVLIKEIKAEIDNQIKKGVYISKHLKKGAIDIRSRDMNMSEREQLKKAAKGIAVTVILETTHPHFHLLF